MKICEYGCGQKAKHQFKNGKWCCEKDWRRCPEKLLESRELKKGKSHPMYGIQKSRETREKISKARKGQPSPRKGKTHTLESRKKMSESMKGRIPWNKGMFLTKSQIKARYPTFYKVEEIRYSPNSKRKTIQVRCKNHNCPNSKEQGGWFTPTYIQLYERIRALESENGSEGAYYYCCKDCKESCPLYSFRPDYFLNKSNDNDIYFTSSQYNVFRQFVLERDNYKCQYCEKPATIVHHERPQKLEPLFVLDPDFAWSCCEECHYKYGHKTGTECSTGNLASKIC